MPWWLMQQFYARKESTWYSFRSASKTSTRPGHLLYRLARVHLVFAYITSSSTQANKFRSFAEVKQNGKLKKKKTHHCSTVSSSGLSVCAIFASARSSPALSPRRLECGWVLNKKSRSQTEFWLVLDRISYYFSPLRHYFSKDVLQRDDIIHFKRELSPKCQDRMATNWNGNELPGANGSIRGSMYTTRASTWMKHNHVN